MNSHTPKIKATLFFAAAGICLYFGWREFWFMTDDAYIAFRYASNSVLGHGYVWNAAPFRPVEGYTSFLYILILEWVWRLFAVEPPKAANFLSLIFSFGSLGLVTIAVMKMKLNEQLEPVKPLLTGAVLFGLVFNPTFLTWASSGLETALFNFLILAWLLTAIMFEQKNNGWRLTVSIIAALAYLTRPDGILVVAATLILVFFSFARELKLRRFGILSVVSILPLFTPMVHVIWRKSFYGEWLPNTYYAKYVAAWPEAGMRYLLSFVIEYGIWLWLTLLVFFVTKNTPMIAAESKRLLTNLKQTLSDSDPAGFNKLCTVVAVATVVVHVAYYTFNIGGDHFEWRVFSYLPPIILLSYIYFLCVLNVDITKTLFALSLLIFFSLPIPWATHAAEKQVENIPMKETLKITTSDKLPLFMWPLAKCNDKLQDWLTDHLLCVRWREHQLFLEAQLKYFPERSLQVCSEGGRFPTAAFSTVGVPGWVFPNVAIIDAYGLNDYIIARHQAEILGERRMAHDRRPPEQYLVSYLPNISVPHKQEINCRKRPDELELTEEKIKKLEKYWEDKIVHGLIIPDSLGPFPFSLPQ